MKVNEVIAAFILNETGSGANTMSTGGELILYGHTLAKRTDDGRIIASLAGFPSKLTRQRLNTMLAMMGFARKFWQQDGHQYFGDSKMFQSIEADQWVVIV